MYRALIILLFLAASCTPIQKATFKAEESHYALYRQKALIVYEVTGNKVLLTNPSCTRCYFLKGRDHAEKWGAGDTMMIDSNLVDFYSLHFSKCEKPL
jgi:ribosomal protein S27AE